MSRAQIPYAAKYTGKRECSTVRPILPPSARNGTSEVNSKAISKIADGIRIKLAIDDFFILAISGIITVEIKADGSGS